MLYISQVDKAGWPVRSGWHTGEPLPKIVGPVVTFQADGEELQVILGALRNCQGKEGKSK